MSADKSLAREIADRLQRDPRVFGPPPVDAAAAELRRLDASEAALVEALEWCIEDSVSAVHEHVKSYGETYRAPQLAVMRKAVEKARAALARAKEARNV